MLENELSDEERDSIKQEMGMDALIRQFKAGKLSGEDVLNCSVEFFGNLSYLSASKITMGMIGADARKNIIQKILSTAEEKFDVVITDAGAGRRKEDMDVVAGSNLVVAVCGQGRKSIMNALEAGRNLGIEENRMFLVIAKYLTESRYNIRNLRYFCRNVGNDSIGDIPFSYQYMDVIEDQIPAAFLKCFEREADISADPLFYTETAKCAGKILEKAAKNEKNRKL